MSAARRSPEDACFAASAPFPGKDGREHWRPTRLEFDSAERDRFRGAWGCCGDAATNETWRGDRLL